MALPSVNLPGVHLPKLICQEPGLAGELGLCLEQAFEQQSDLSHLGFVFDIVLFHNVDRESSVVIELPQLTDEPAVVDFALPNSNLKLVWRGVSEPHAVDVFHDLVDRPSGVGAADVVAGVER